MCVVLGVSLGQSVVLNCLSPTSEAAGVCPRIMWVFLGLQIKCVVLTGVLSSWEDQIHKFAIAKNPRVKSKDCAFRG